MDNKNWYAKGFSEGWKWGFLFGLIVGVVSLGIILTIKIVLF